MIAPSGSLDSEGVLVNDLIKRRNIRLEVVYQVEGADAPKSFSYGFSPQTSIRIGVPLNPFAQGAKIDHVGRIAMRRRQRYLAPSCRLALGQLKLKLLSKPQTLL
jgi:hypothetical protein